MRYTIENKPKFINGQKVRFTIDGGPDEAEGTILGLSTEHIIDFWIVKIDKTKPSKIQNFKFDAICVQHTFFFETIEDECKRLGLKPRSEGISLKDMNIIECYIESNPKNETSLSEEEISELEHFSLSKNGICIFSRRQAKILLHSYKHYWGI